MSVSSYQSYQRMPSVNASKEVESQSTKQSFWEGRKTVLVSGVGGIVSGITALVGMGILATCTQEAMECHENETLIKVSAGMAGVGMTFGIALGLIFVCNVKSRSSL